MTDGPPRLHRTRPEGQYANSFKVGYNAFEFVIEFGQRHAGGERERMHTRIVTAPDYARALASLLARSLSRYEKAFGVIRRPARSRRRSTRD